MTIEIMTAITIFSIGVNIYLGFLNARRNKTSDDKMDATQIATVIVKLDSIESSVNDIKADNKTFRLDIQDIRERLVKVEQKVQELEQKKEVS